MSAIDYAIPCPCGCGEKPAHGSPEFRALQRVYLDPRLAVHRLSTMPVDHKELNAIVNLTLNVPVLREEGATALFIRFITKGYERKPASDIASGPYFHDGSRLWHSPLMGLLQVLEATANSSDEMDLKDIQLIKDSYQAVVDVVWDDVLSLLPPGSAGDFMRRTVGKFIIACAELVPGLKRQMVDRKTLGLTMHCWAYSSRQGRLDLISIIETILGDDYKPKKLDMAVKSIGADVLASKFREWLTDPEVVDEKLWSDFEAMGPFLTSGCSFTDVFIDAKTYQHVLAALLREKQGTCGTCKLNVYLLGDQILTNMARKSEEPTRVFIRMLEFGLLDFVAEATCVTLAENEDSRKKGRKLLSTYRIISHVPKCPSPNCEVPCTSDFLRACHAAFLPIYLPTLSRLQAMGTVRSLEALRMWTTFAIDVGVTAEACRSATVGEKECGNAMCPKSGLTGREEKMKLCSGCRRRRYCSIDCQKADWKFHKSHCQGTN